MPIISLIIPIYNVEKYLRRCLDSVVLQNFKDMEVIMINDGSTDNSAEIARIYYKKYSQFVLIEQSNKGLSAARNTGLRYASGEYIMYLDSDDYFEPNAINTCVKILSKSHLDLLFFSGNKVICDRNDETIKIEQYGPDFVSKKNTGLELYYELRKNKNYYTCVYYQVINRCVLENNHIKFFEGILHEDHLYTFMVLAVSNKSMCINQRLYDYRVRENSIMTSKTGNGKRFEGFATTFCQMLKWYYDNNEKVYSKKIRNTITKHLKYSCFVAMKYYIKMSKNELDEYKDLTYMLLHGIKTQKYFYDIRYIIFYNIHRLANTIYSIIKK